MDAVERAKEHIAAGDAFQIVPSQRVRRRTGASPFAIYRALRAVNPSPYMFLLDIGELPAGRRRRPRRTSGSTWTAPASCGRSPARGRAAPTAPRTTPLADELLADREGAGRARDAGRPGAQRPGPRVRAGQRAGRRARWSVERYSHVMHIVSHVSSGSCATTATRPRCCARRSRPGRCRARPRCGRCRSSPSWRAAAAAPTAAPSATSASAATWTPASRSARSSMRDGVAYLQAGAGIVADSDPADEHQECMNKLAALGAAHRPGRDGGVRAVTACS